MTTPTLTHPFRLRSPSYGSIGLEGAVFETFDYAQRYQSVHDFSIDLNVGLIRERCTGEHGECTSKRQHQCENLFEMAYENLKTEHKLCS